MDKIAQGAEAILHKQGEEVIKERFAKKYRVPALDTSLRQFRTRREAKILGKLETFNFPAPHLKSFCDKRMTINMDFIQGDKLKDVLIEGDQYQKLAREFGSKIGLLHSRNIVHGDLTTSNILVGDELHFIDFGLSQFSDKIEDKAVDLFLMERAFEATHTEIHEKALEEIYKGYKESCPEAKHIIERLKSVRKRGRNKNK